MIKHPEQRVGIFIDVQNMYYSARNLYNAKVNFANIVKEATGSRKLVRAIAYVVRTATGEEKPFHEALTHAGIELREKDLQEFFGGEKKADWDVGLAVDAIRISALLDTIVIVSGDGDYCPLVEYLKNQGRQVEIVAFRETASSKLVEMADEFTDMSQDKAKFLIGSRRAPARRTTRKTPTRRTPTKR
ncbi:NYN domain-containing protein [Candidatus Saccharibacteria bacterium]|nr:NYN domain-containing protein [Candidatus Saccharibacteria bacterium]NIV03925.1 NYN domain-containing protein [Calditrichia bacterium]NIS38486.1 NYN domain-containing protein [Candidatus Saccharibacteria bacterium]NIV72282.1 NYN domain-containing protein [Calditrichia bacterium]NIV99254.1 NYN domain-containing protein [Candidatus Saccharibacteria bacterium]